MFTNMHTHTYVGINGYAHIDIHARASVAVDIDMRVRLCVPFMCPRPSRMDKLTHACMHAYRYRNIHTYVYRRTYACIETCMKIDTNFASRARSSHGAHGRLVARPHRALRRHHALPPCVSVVPCEYSEYPREYSQHPREYSEDLPPRSAAPP